MKLRPVHTTGLLPLIAALSVAARAQTARPDTRGDRHPHVRRDREGRFVFRNEHLVAVLDRAGDGFGGLRVYPASRPTQPTSEPVALIPTLSGAEGTPLSLVRTVGVDRLIQIGRASCRERGEISGV